jgi:hypothetical protein
MAVAAVRPKDGGRVVLDDWHGILALFFMGETTDRDFNTMPCARAWNVISSM